LPGWKVWALRQLVRLAGAQGSGPAAAFPLLLLLLKGQESDPSYPIDALMLA
jgi:hypothetical protein